MASSRRKPVSMPATIQAAPWAPAFAGVTAVYLAGGGLSARYARAFFPSCLRAFVVQLASRSRRASHRLEDGGDALAAADALCREGVALALAFQEGCRLAGDARSGGAKRVAEGERAAVDIHLGEVDPEVAHAGEGLRGERFVEL